MGSVMNNDDLIGAKMTLYDESGAGILSCGSHGMISVDGSGFYSCNTQAKTIAVYKQGNNGSRLTVCDLAIYEEENLTT